MMRIKKIIVLVVCVCIFCAVFSFNALAGNPVVTRMEGTSEAITFPGLGAGTVKTEILHAVDGKLAYCIDNDLKFNEGTAVEMTTQQMIGKTQWNNEAEFAKAALAEYYIKNECGVSMSEYQKNWMSQILIWCLCSKNMAWNRMASGLSASVQDQMIYGYDDWYSKNKNKYKVSWKIYTNAGILDSQPLAMFFVEKAEGKVKLKKVSTDTFEEGNICYEFTNAEYGIYKQDKITKVGTLKVSESGESNEVSLPEGTYYVKEEKAPAGYILNKEGEDGDGYYKAEVTIGKTVNLTVKDDPVYSTLKLQLNKKIKDYKGEAGLPSLEGTEFCVEYYGGYFDSEEAAKKAYQEGKCSKRAWMIETKYDSEGNCVTALDKEHLAGGDDLFIDGNGEEYLPLGTIIVRESRAAAGYSAENAFFRDAAGEFVSEGYLIDKIVMADEDAKFKLTNEYIVEDAVVRADISIKKTAENTGNALAGVRFNLKNENTGETVEFETDENGFYSSGSSYLSHEAEGGIWFGENEPDDDMGALTFGRYTLTELRGEANRHMKLESRSFEINEETKDTTIGLDILNSEITIKTRAVDGDDGDGYLEDSGIVRVADNVSYHNLTPGNTYTLKGRLIDVKSGDPILLENGEYEVFKEFIPENTDGTEIVEFVFDAGNADRTAVVFEYLYECPVNELNEETIPIVYHEDPEDKEQTIRIISINTSAENEKDNGKVLGVEENVVIVDHVECKGLEPGDIYTLTGKLMDKETGLEINGSAGEERKVLLEFTAEESDMTVDLKFDFDTTGFEGKEVVVFEKLYCGSSTELNDDTLPVAIHEDLENKNQTVEVDIKPVITPEAEKPSNGNKAKNVTAPKTGDTMGRSVIICVVSLLTATTVVVIAIKKKMNIKKKSKHVMREE